MIKIIADSSCDLNDDIRKQYGIINVPLTMTIEGKEYVDDMSLDRAAYLEHMRQSKQPPKTACPSPYEYMESFSGADMVFVVTLSSQLSNSYSSAELARQLYLEDQGDALIHVFDSRSASVAETLICCRIGELANEGMVFADIIRQTDEYIAEQKTFFLLESLEHLAKAGRLNPLIAKLATVLSVKPILGANQQGSIFLMEKNFGYKRALARFVQIIGAEGRNLEEKVLGIAHCNCQERAQEFMRDLQKLYRFKDAFLVDTAGLSSTYADEGGIIVAF